MPSVCSPHAVIRDYNACGAYLQFDQEEGSWICRQPYLKLSVSSARPFVCLTFFAISHKAGFASSPASHSWHLLAAAKMWFNINVHFLMQEDAGIIHYVKSRLMENCGAVEVRVVVIGRKHLRIAWKTSRRQPVTKLKLKSIFNFWINCLSTIWSCLFICLFICLSECDIWLTMWLETLMIIVFTPQQSMPARLPES